MDFNPPTYQPIDYRQWILGDKARQGVNIKRLQILNKKELELFNASVHYQDARNDAGHAELTAYFAKIFLSFYPNAIPEVVVPTAIVHDNGWYGGDPDAWNRLVQEKQKQGRLKDLDSPEFRKQHQDKGAEMALELFRKIGYPPKKYYQEGYEIIKDHDTRLNPTTPSGRVVRDADYVWRATLPHAKIYMDNLNPEEVIKRVEETCLNTKPPKNLETTAKQIAKIELANTLHYKFQEQGAEVLKQKGYKRELEIVKRFYSNSI